jgi:purine-nucleoside phosphorylase
VFIEKKVREAVEFLRRRGVAPSGKGMVLDAGMGGFSNELSSLTVVPMRRLPHFPQPLGSGEKGKLLSGLLDGSSVVIQQGRSYLHEGYFHRELALPLRVLAALGVHRVVLVAGVYSLRPDQSSGEIVLIGDHIDLTGGTALKGLLTEGRSVFPLQLSQARTEVMKKKALEAAKRAGVSLREGVAALVSGPSLPTPAETRVLATLGADVLDLSLAAEISMAAYLGIEVVTIGFIMGAVGEGADPLCGSGWGERPLAYLKELLRDV